MNVSSQGMSAQRERLEAASSNLANANSTRSPEGGVYRRRDVVFEAVDQPQTAWGGPDATDAPSRFDDELSSFRGDFEHVNQHGTQGVSAKTLRARPDDVVKRFDPEHPDADADGYVSMPAVDPLEETVNMLSAARSFEANATAFNTAKEMVRTSLKLGEA
jgi:flagellar basal-body rod protein FlgC